MSDKAAGAELAVRMRRKHQELMARQATARVTAEERSAFIAELQDCGQTVPPGRDRDRLQNALYFWASDRDARPQPEAGDLAVETAPAPATPPTELPKLKPYILAPRSDGDGGVPELKPSEIAVAELTQTQKDELERTRSLVRIAALARQYGSVGDAEKPGYLLSGSALAEARLFVAKDPAIAAFVAASDSAEKMRTEEEVARRTADLKREMELKSQKTRDRIVALSLILLLMIGFAVLLLFKNSALTLEQNETKRLNAQLLEQLRAREATYKELLGYREQTPVGQRQRIDAIVEREREALPPDAIVSAPPASASQPRPPPLPAPRPGAPACAGYIWIGSNDEKKITSTGPLETLRAGTQVTVQANDDLRLRRSFPSDAYVMAPSFGLVSMRAELEITGAPRGWPRPNGQTQFWAPVRAARPYCTSVFVHYAGDASKLDDTLAKLVRQGFQTPPTQQLSTASGLSEIRYFFEEDAASAQDAAEALAMGPGGRSIEVKPLLNFPRKPPSGTMELWIDLTR